jgi:alpha-tubulin suppressor-like RCC1 family protein
LAIIEAVNWERAIHKKNQTRQKSRILKLPQGKSVVAGYHQTIALDFDDNVWTFGNNIFGQLGLGHTTNVLIPTKIVGFKFKSVSTGYRHTAALDFDNNAWVFGDNNSGQLGLGG